MHTAVDLNTPFEVYVRVAVHLGYIQNYLHHRCMIYSNVKCQNIFTQDMLRTASAMCHADPP